MKSEQVGVAGDYQLRRTIDGKLEKFVVLRVTASAYDMHDRDSFGNTIKQPQELLALAGCRIGVELRTGENLGKLDDGVIGSKQPRLGNGLANSLPRD